MLVVYALGLVLCWKVCAIQACQSEDIRLVGGSSDLEGRVEVCYEDSWGTVCDDHWGIINARVACNQLGYGPAAQYWSSAHFGQGSGSILFHNLTCTGNETSLFDCSHSGVNNSHCGHHDDAGVTCSLPVPTNLTATSITSRAFSLSWQATNLTSGNMSFRIYYQQQNCSSCALQTQEENDRARRSQRISGQEVVPYSTYRVYMTLIYNSNESEPSGTITLTTQLAPPSAPTGLRPTDSGASPTSIGLSWSLPTTDYGVDYRLLLTYTDMSNEAPRHSMTEEFPDQRQSYTITSLQPGARYKCCISAENSAGPSSSTCTYENTTETAPSGSPTNFMPDLASASATMVTLMWRVLPYSQRNGIIRRYSLEVCQIDPLVSGCTNHASNEDQTSLVISSLHPYYVYHWRVAAHTSVGRGPYSSYISFRMPEDVPSGPPVNVSHVTDLANPTMATFMWREPLFPQTNGMIIGYNLRICQTHPDGGCTDYTISNGGTSKDIPLHPYYVYNWRVAAHTSVGRGPYSNHISFQMPEDVPGGSPVSLQTNPTSSITVTLVWNDLPYSQRNGVIVRYSVEVCQIEPHGSCKTSPTNGNQTSLVISSLHPYYEYNWRVAANTSVGRGPYSSYTSFVMPEDVPGGPPLSLHADPMSSTRVNLTWSDPPSPQRNGEITGYSVEVCQTDPGGSCRTLPTNGDQTSLDVPSLHPYSLYDWRVAAHTSVGRGPYSSYTSFRMPEDAPSGPPQYIGHEVLSYASIRLFWALPLLPDRNGDITGYSVQVLTTDNNVYSTHEAVEEEITVVSLKEYTLYKFRVSAVTRVGKGPYETYGPVTTAMGWTYGLSITASILFVLVLLTVVLFVSYWCQTRSSHLKSNATFIEANSRACKRSRISAKLHESKKDECSNPETSHRDDTNPARPQASNFLLRLRNWFKQEKADECEIEQPPIPQRYYLEDEEFMETSFNQPAVPKRGLKQDNDKKPALPPRLYLKDEEFVQGLEEEANHDDGSPYYSTVREERTYKPLIPPCFHEEGCDKEESMHQGLTMSKSKDGYPSHCSEAEPPPVNNYSTAMTPTSNSEGHYQPLMRRDETGHYQSLIKREGTRHYWSPAIGANGSTERATGNNSEGHYQALTKQRESESTYQPLIPRLRNH